MKRASVIFFMLVIGLIAGCNEAVQPGRFMVSGSMEATTVTLSSKVSGDVMEIVHREGTQVEAGEVLLRIDAIDYELQRDQAAARVAQAEAALQLVLKGAREEDRKLATKNMEVARVSLRQAQADEKRISSLRDKGSATEKQLDDVSSLVEIRQAQYDASVQAYRKVKRGSRQEEIDMARAVKMQVEASLALLDKKIQDCVITSPLSSIVTEQLLEKGEMVTPGRDVCILADLSMVKLRVYVPEKQLPHIRYGQEVDVRIDGSDQVFKGSVTYISDIAEFTPKTIQTRDERVKLVFAVDIELDNTSGMLKAGMPADAYFSASSSG